jgi:integrase
MPQSKIIRPPNTIVTIYNNNNNLLLRFTYQGESINYSLGLPVTPKNLKIAEKKAILITQEITFNTFKIENYRKKKEIKVEKKINSLCEILDFYANCKGVLDSSTLDSIKILKDWISYNPKFDLPENLQDLFFYLRKSIPHLNSDKKGYSDKHIASHLAILRSAIYLAKDFKKIDTTFNVAELFKLLKTNKTKDIKVYSKEEIKIIIETAYTLFDYFIYGAFIEFRFLTGARPSEVIPLTWGDLITIEDKQFILFNKRFTDGILKKGLKKKDEYRLFPINDQLSNFFSKLPKTNDLIFVSLKGTYLDSHNFSNRQWKQLLNKLLEEKKIKFYIPFYDERHCFGSHVCRQTTDLKTVSYLMGNSPSTLQKHYLSIDSNFEVPEI